MNRQDNFFVPGSSATIIFRCVTLFIVLFAIQQTSIAQNNKYKIVYNVLEDKEKDNYELYSMNMDGSDKKNITNTPGVEWVYYAYKNKVYYISDIDTCHRCYFLYEMDAEGNGKRKICDLQLEDSWMGSRKKGTEMVVLGKTKARPQLFVVNIKTGNYQQITDDTVSYKADPIFLPGGSSIVLRYRTDRKLRQTEPAELWFIEYYKPTNGFLPANTLKYRITNFPKSDTTTQWFEYHAGPPQYNLKYKFITYLSKQNNQTQIYAVQPDLKKGFQSVQVTQITSGNLSSGWHSWSSDGKWLAMDKTNKEEKGYDIYLMNYKTKKTIQLTSDEKYEQAPVIVEVRKP